MKTLRRDIPEHLQELHNNEIDLDDGFIDICWEDALKRNIQMFWESIDDEEID